MDAPNDWTDHKTLIEDGFIRYMPQKIVTSGDCLGSVQIAGGRESSVELLANNDFSFSLAKDEIPEIVLQGTGFVYAPVVEGDDAGFAYICIDGSPIGKVPLVYGKTVEQEIDQHPSLWRRLFGGEGLD